MSRLPRMVRVLGCAAWMGPPLLLAACSTLGGNVGGDFACRAPEGSCAPTTAIDAAAIGVSASGGLAGGHVRGGDQHSAIGTSERNLRIVIAARRDEAGRTHDARVVHVTLPEPVGESWRQPESTGDLLRAIGQAIAPQPTSSPTNHNSPLPALPGQLFLPSPTGPASLGAETPEGGAPGSSPLPDRVPQSLSEHGAIDMQLDNLGDHP